MATRAKKCHHFALIAKPAIEENYAFRAFSTVNGLHKWVGNK